MPITNFNYHLRRFAFVRSFLVLFLFSLISTLLAENENYFDLKIVLLISKEIIFFKKNLNMNAVYLHNGGGKINYARFDIYCLSWRRDIPEFFREFFKKIRVFLGDRKITRYSKLFKYFV